MSNNGRCTFDPTTHRYTLDGKPVPSVTQVLEMGGLSEDWSRVPEHVRAYAAQRGTYVHEACELFDYAWDDAQQRDRAIPWIQTLDPVLRGYVAAWAKFREHEPFVPHTMEELVYTDYGGGLAGTIDRFGKWSDQWCVLEIKTGKSISWNTAHQLAAYTYLKWLIVGDPGTRRQVVHLHDDGTYDTPAPYDSPGDWHEFDAAWTVTHAKLRRGIPLPGGSR